MAPHTREKVRLSAQTLGYRVNAAARSLVTNRTGTIALVIGDNDERVFREPFFAALAHGAGRYLAGRGYLLALVASWPGLQTDFLRAGHVDGIVLASAHHLDPMVVKVLESDVPVVLVGGLPQAPHLPAVDADNVGGARAATEHLLRQGCRRVATITGPPHMPVTVARQAGWQSALDGFSGMAGPVASGNFEVDSGRSAMERILASDPGVDGVFAASDLMALGAYSAIRDAGLHVGRDVRVVGFDDSPEALTAHPSLSTVRQPMTDLGQKAAGLLLDLVDQKPGVILQQTLPTELIVRHSS